MIKANLYQIVNGGRHVWKARGPLATILKMQYRQCQNGHPHIVRVCQPSA